MSTLTSQVLQDAYDGKIEISIREPSVYFINTKEGPVCNHRGVRIEFSSFTHARHYAINYLDLSDDELEIIKIGG